MVTKFISVRDYHQNIATLYKMEPLTGKNAVIEKLAQEIKESREEISKGRAYDFEQVCSKLGLQNIDYKIKNHPLRR